MYSTYIYNLEGNIFVLLELYFSIILGFFSPISHFNGVSLERVAKISSHLQRDFSQTL